MFTETTFHTRPVAIQATTSIAHLPTYHQKTGKVTEWKDYELEQNMQCVPVDNRHNIDKLIMSHYKLI